MWLLRGASLRHARVTVAHFLIDDRVPVDEHGKTLTQPNGNEMWVPCWRRPMQRWWAHTQASRWPPAVARPFTGNAGVSFHLQGTEWSTVDLNKNMARKSSSRWTSA